MTRDEMMQARLVGTRENIDEKRLVRLAEDTMSADYENGERTVSEKDWSDVVFGFVDVYEEERHRQETVAANLARLEGMEPGDGSYVQFPPDEDFVESDRRWTLETGWGGAWRFVTQGGWFLPYPYALLFMRGAIRGGATVESAADPSDVGGTDA